MPANNRRSIRENRYLKRFASLHTSTRDPRDYLPDVRDGLTHWERTALQSLYDLP